MSYNKFLIALLSLVFLSGSFTLGRLQIEGFNIEVRYILLLLFVLALFVPNKQTISKNMKITKPFAILLLVCFLYFFASMVSIFYSENISISFRNFTDILLIELLILGLLYIVIITQKDVFFWFVSGLLIFFGLVYTIPIYLSIFSGDARGEFNLGGPNVTTRILFFASCSSLYRFFIRKSMIYFIFSILFLVGIVFLGSRGGLLGAILTVLVLWFVKYFFREWKIKKYYSVSYKKMVPFAIGIGILSFVYAPLKRVFESRIIGTTFNNGGIYTAGRDNLYEQAVGMIKEKPIFGYGLGGFASHSTFDYPHNLLLEMMINIGLFGAMFFVMLFAVSIFLIFKLKNSKLYILSGLPFYMIIVQMFSGGIYDFRYYFFWVVPLMYYGLSFKENNTKTVPVELLKVKSSE